MKVIIEVTFGIRRNFFSYSYKSFFKENSNLPVKFFFKQVDKRLPILEETLVQLNKLYKEFSKYTEILIFVHPKLEMHVHHLNSLPLCKFVYVPSVYHAYKYFLDYVKHEECVIEVGCDYDDLAIVTPLQNVNDGIYNFDTTYVVVNDKLYELKKESNNFISYITVSRKLSGYRGLGLRFCIMDYKQKVHKSYPNSIYIIKTSTHHMYKYISSINWGDE